MNSKRNSLIACAVATALGSSAALALPPTTTPDFVLYAAGGSAQANAFFTAANTIFTSATLSSYSDSTTACADSSSYRVVFGSVATAFTFNGATVAAGKNVLYFYKFNGGSFPNGVNPQVGTGVGLAYPNVSTIIPGTTTFPLPSSETCTNAGAPNFVYSDSGQLNNTQLPDWGAADVEVGMFQGYNNSSGTCATASTTINCLGPSAPTVGASNGIYDNLFGVAVTQNVYGSTAHPKTNFTRAEMAGILAGTTSDWSQLYDDNGKQMPAQRMILIDRGQGSGTKASGSQYFLGYPGNGSAEVLPGSANFGYSGNSVNTGVTTYQDVAESSTTNEINDLLACQAAGKMCVAVIGLENPPALHQVSGANQYAFTKINGVAVDTQGASDNVNGTVATSYANVVTGAYDFFYQNSFNTRTGVLSGTTTGDLFANEFQTVMQTGAFVGANSGLKFPHAVNGTLQDADKLGGPVKGGTMVTRGGVSPSDLLPAFSAIQSTSGPPLGSDPL